MELLFYLLSLTLLLYALILFRDFTHPVFITVSIWLSIICIYNCVIRKTGIWIHLSDNFYSIISIYISLFTISAGIISRTKFSIRKNHNTGYRLKHLMLLNISIIAISILNIYYINIIRTEGFSLVRETTEFGNNLPIYIKLSSYFVPLGIILLFIGLDNEYTKKKYKLKLAFLSLTILISIFVSTNKGGIFQIGVCSVYFLKTKNKLNKKNVLLLTSFLLSIIISLQLLRSNTQSKTNNFLTTFLYTYILSPLPAFDAVISGIKKLDTNYFGELSLSFFYRFFNKLSICDFTSKLQQTMWINVPYPTNVYTLPGFFYIDFGIPGIFSSAILYGVIFGKLYSSIKYKNNISNKLFYALYVYCLVFQFFGDWFFSFFSTTLQSFFWIFILTHKFKIHIKRHTQ